MRLRVITSFALLLGLSPVVSEAGITRDGAKKKTIIQHKRQVARLMRTLVGFNRLDPNSPQARDVIANFNLVAANSSLGRFPMGRDITRYDILTNVLISAKNAKLLATDGKKTAEKITRLTYKLAEALWRCGKTVNQGARPHHSRIDSVVNMILNAPIKSAQLHTKHHDMTVQITNTHITNKQITKEVHVKPRLFDLNFFSKNRIK